MCTAIRLALTITHRTFYIFPSLTTMDTQLGGCVAMRNLGFGEGKSHVQGQAATPGHHRHLQEPKRMLSSATQGWHPLLRAHT